MHRDDDNTNMSLDTIGADLRRSLLPASSWIRHINHPEATNTSSLSTMTDVLQSGTEEYVKAVNWGKTMQDERDEAIAIACYWKNVAAEMARGQTGSTIVQNFIASSQCISYSFNIAAPAQAPVPPHHSIGMHQENTPQFPAALAASASLAIRTRPSPPTYSDRCSRELAEKSCARGKCKYVHEDQVEMYKDVIQMLIYANKEDEMQAEGVDEVMEGVGSSQYFR